MKHKRLFELAKPYLEGNDLGVAHTLRVLDIARQHFEIPDGIREETYALVMVHDIGGSSVKDQYEKGPEIATRILRQVGYNESVVRAVCENIRRHHDRPENPSEPFKILYDADHLVMFSEEEFPHYNSRPSFDWESIIDDFYHAESKDLARRMLKERGM